MGSRDKKPRQGSRWAGWAEEVTQRYEAAEYFDEDVSSAWELNQKLYRSKHVPLKYRMYAAGKMVDIEPRPVTVEEQKEASDEAAEFIVAELRKLKRSAVYEHDAFLHGMIDTGKFSEATALEIRAYLLKRRSRAQQHAAAEGVDDIDIPEWVPVACPQPGQAADTAPLRLLENGANPRQNGAGAAD
jgi:hypothetical protein